MQHSLKSSVIEGASYDPKTKVMTVKFRTGKSYSYAAVPQDIFDGLLKAESAGKYHTAHLKGKFKQPDAAK